MIEDLAESESFCKVDIKGCVRAKVKDYMKTRERIIDGLNDMI